MTTKTTPKDQKEGLPSHYYGSQVTILDDPLLLTYLSQVGHPETKGLKLHHLMERLYLGLFGQAARALLPKVKKKIPTRMAQDHPDQGYFEGRIIDPETKAVTVGLARAGTLPSQYGYLELQNLLREENVRQDHLYVGRKTNDQGQVIGLDSSGSKIGGDVEGSYVFFPDPMGATGTTLDYALRTYKEQVPGKAKAYCALHLIITPEYIRRMKAHHPDLSIFCLRVDRGLSPVKVKESPLGKYLDQEVGLNHLQYIVPGAGGLGEVLNNSFV